MGLCPIAPPKGFPFSAVCFRHWRQQPKTSLETFGQKYLVLFLKYQFLLDSFFDFLILGLNQSVRITSRFTRRRYSALAVSETSSAITNAHHTPVTSPVIQPMAYAHGMSTTS